MPPVTPEYLAKRRATILAAAAHCFATKGLHSTSMPDICTQAGMSAGGVYRYFASKEELIEELADTVMAPVLRVLHTALDSDPVPRPAEVIDLIHDTLLIDSPPTTSSALMLQLWSEVAGNARVRESQRRYMTELLDVLSGFTRRWAQLDDESALATANALVAMSMGTFLVQNVLEADMPTTSTRKLLEALDPIVRSG
ncbi:TetR/AcrR family transcriptional regulator [Nocardia sp. NPDC005998]|uniref:TetR/AcrR family transcriptional regulator n=1 Tax=Nocardia sp. NPDC005998 TaxID=3156894 RepID=UPI0033BF4AFF